jgi:hypothetical protein
MKTIINYQIRITKQITAGLEVFLLLEISAWLLVIFFILVLGHCLLLYILFYKLLHIKRYGGFDFNGHFFYGMDKLDSVRVQ